MAISEHTARLHWSAPAVLCCRTAAGEVIRPDHLEDPLLFPELEAAGVLQVGEAIGTTLRRTVEGLTALTPELVVGGAEPTAAEGAGASCSRQGTAPAQRLLRTLHQRLFAVKAVVIGDRTAPRRGACSSMNSAPAPAAWRRRCALAAPARPTRAISSCGWMCRSEGCGHGAAGAACGSQSLRPDCARGARNAQNPPCRGGGPRAHPPRPAPGRPAPGAAGEGGDGPGRHARKAAVAQRAGGGGGGDVERFRRDTGPTIARLLQAEEVDVAVFTGGCGTCHRSAVIIAALPPIAQQEGAPRITAPHVPIGANAGEPGNAAMQRGILLESLRAVAELEEFGVVKELAYGYRR